MQNKNIFYTLGVIIILVFFYSLFLSAPSDFPKGVVFTIEQGSSLRNVSLKLKREHIITSRMAFEAFIIFFGNEKSVKGADYYFEDSLPVYEVARRIAKGEHHMAPITVTIPEGFSLNQIGDVCAGKLTNFNETEFLKKTQSLEGTLFPDTYHFLTTDTEKEVIKSMRVNFEKKIAPLRADILNAKKSESDIINMASIIEGESKGDADRAIISGILWKRISLHMGLQVDVAPETYKVLGLPKSPVGNPGILAIKAAIYPQTSPYLYYLHDKNGNVHYAKSFAEHQINIQKFLK